MVESYPELYETFRWHVPKGFNLANACCFQWSGLPGHEQRPALIFENRAGHTDMVTFAELGKVSAQLANGLVRLGVIPGDRVVIMMSNPSDLLTALLACWAVRAVAVPMNALNSADALLPRLKQARSQVALIDAANQGEALAAIAKCPRIKHIVGIDVYDGRVMSWRGLIARQPAIYVPSQCLPSDPALMVWPDHALPDIEPQSALVLAHQSLIGQLPGFVMTSNWFPDQARQVLTTLKPWEESGLLAAILPALYFGHTVVLTDRLPAAANLPSQVTHIVTTGSHLIDALKTDPVNVPTPQPVSGLAVLDQTLHHQWREQSAKLYGAQPNLATFVSGCGLLISQCHRKWPDEPAHSSGYLVPGHHVRLANKSDQSSESNGQTGELEISRVDRAGQTDPAQFVQAWPFKDTLDLSTVLPDWWRTGIYAQDLGNGHWRVLGQVQHWHRMSQQPLSLSELEQAVLLDHQIKWAEVAFMPNKKSPYDEHEIWVLVDTGPTQERLFKAWRDGMRLDIINRILQTTQLDQDSVKIRVGLVDRHSLPLTDPHSRSAWHTRAYQALVDFL
ncbi:class I adenylate-forming enzyme family protein [Orrella daihaiensis]|uniref:Acyl--CoA ligase n=1 Tax=Orrella daihaiensis TaxID=2782176 RepID=A0ABY4ANC4_9BURK|nr:class I adenylate-forming enzyme family protein [Orrella daihaiensis]UOD49549.1 acyl--CoA ligase [Orrella daihaiensis]